MFTEAADVNSLYEEALQNLKTRKPIDAPGKTSSPNIAEQEQNAKDYYANVRTNVSIFYNPSVDLFIHNLV
jgi:chitin synthase